MNSRMKLMVVSSSTVICLLLLVGLALGQSSTTDDTLKHIRVFSQVVAHIQNEYVEDPDMKSVTLGALDGMLEAIDPFGSYLSPEQYRDYQKNHAVDRAGVGLILSKKPGWVSVLSAIPGSPAAKANLTTFDMIESIKGISTRDMPLAYAEMLLQGDAGTDVELSVVRVRHTEPQTVKLTRAKIALPALDTKMLAGGVGYLDINSLSPAHVKDAAAAIKQLQKDGAKKLMVDLRNCATGAPEDGIALANLFLKSGRITYLKGQRVPQQNFDADASKAVTDLPMVVLTNRGTASGAEIAAAAILADKRGQVVGERTYGDAAQRKALTMDDGSAIILSVAKYYSPDGKAIQDTSVKPSTEVADIEPPVDVDDNGMPLPTAEQNQPESKRLEDDPVVKKALEVLG
jgi:carboxyl-terminal processing protease